MKTRNRHIALAVRAALLATPWVGLVHAADQSGLEEVVVYGQAQTYRPDDQTTATGLQLALIDTPQSVSVISDDMLRLFNAQSVYDVLDMVPGASRAGTGFGLQQILLRGQPVSRGRINGISGRSQQFVDSAALERVELVRGPATALYGVTGAFGGELNQILRKPKKGFHGGFGVQGGDFSNSRYDGSITGSIPGTDDRLKASLIGAYTTSGIPQRRVVSKDDNNELWSAAITYDATPNSTFSLYALDEDKTFDPTDGCPLAQTSANVLFIPRSIPVERWYCNDPRQSKSTFTNEFQTASFEHRFANDFNLTAAVARSKFQRNADYTFGFGPAGAFGLADTDVYLYSYSDREGGDDNSANIGLGGSFSLADRTHQFFAAVEYQKTEITRLNFTTQGLGVLNMFRDGGLGVLSDGTTQIPTADEPMFVGTRLNESEDIRVSVQALFNPTDRLQVLVGILTEQREQTVSNNRPGRPLLSSTLDQTNTVGRLGVTYGLVDERRQWLTDAKAYFSYSEGFRPNSNIFDASGAPLTEPQKMDSYEIGLKSQWMDGNVDAAVAVYYQTVTNVPSTIFGQVGTSGGTFSSVLGGNRTFQGIELEVLGEVLPGWNVAFNYTFTKNEIESLLFTQELAVANVPENQVSLFTSYEFLKGRAKGLLLGAGIVSQNNTALVDGERTIFSGNYDPGNQVLWDATRVDFRVSYKGFKGKLGGLELFGNVYNAFDARSFFSTGIPGEPGFSNTVGAPKTVTVGLQYSF